MGEMPEYRIVEDAQHIGEGKQYDVYTNPVSSASIYLPWNVTVAAAITWIHDKLSGYFSIYPLISEQMGNNIL
jgi:hypothetical protein